MMRALFTIIVLIVTSCLLITCSVCSSITVGSGVLETREYPYSGFTNLELSDAFKVDVIYTDYYKVEIKADHNVISQFNILQAGETLVIGLKPERNLNIVAARTKGVIHMPDLQGIKLRGATEANITGFQSLNSLTSEVTESSILFLENPEIGNAHLYASGGSNITGEAIIDNGDFTASGGSVIKLKGSVNNLSVEANDGSKIELSECDITDADLNISGGSTGRINVSGTVNLDLSEGSKLYYKGNPEWGTKEVAEGSRLIQR